MNTEQLKTDVIKFLRRKDSDGISLYHGGVFCSTIKYDEVDVVRAMQDFVSQESKIAVSEFKEKLRRGLFRLDMYGPDAMVKMKDLKDLIDKL